MVLLHGLDLLRGDWQIKQTYTFEAAYRYSPIYPVEQRMVAGLRRYGLLEPLQPPPRVCIPWWLAPANDGMIYHYANFDAYISLFLRRPYDYLHAALGIPQPEQRNTTVSKQVFDFGPFPYPDMGLSAGLNPRTQMVELASDPAPRAYLAYAAEVVDYPTALKRIAKGHDTHQCPLLESPLAIALPQTNGPAWKPAPIRRFELNSLTLDVESNQEGLLVLAEAWYPGWRAEVDGQPCPCVPANAWMRAVPVPAGRHQVRVYFRQNYWLPGALISVASLGLLLTAIGTRPH
jgi:hypothetical protein